ncbi:MAG: hypothetical protein MJ085_02900 [Clostridia bacterium]|nr:hypothetical protein [Clostridia bacterium]
MNEMFRACSMQYILDRIAPVTPFGAELVRALKIYSDEQELSEELHRLKLLFDHPCLEDVTKCLDARLCHLKDIRGSLRSCINGGVLSTIELFEIKLFLLTMQGLIPEYREKLSLPGIEFTSVDAAIEILDPYGRKQYTFIIDDAATPRLLELRRQKAQTDFVLYRTEDASDQAELSLRRSQICEEERKEEYRIRESLSSALMPYCDGLLSNCLAAGRLDWLLRKASMKQRFDAVLPQRREDHIRFDEMIHPELADSISQKGRRFVPISIQLPRGTTLIAGANMGGKTVALRTLMLNLLLVMTGCPVIAKRAELPMLSSLQMLFGDAENETEGLSAFGGEMERLRDALSGFAENGVLILDEPARGTNPEEGTILVRSLAEYLGKKGGFAVIASHYSGIRKHVSAVYRAGGLDCTAYQSLFDTQNVHNATAETIAAHMNYGLERTTSSEDEKGSALAVCKLLGLPDELIKYAETISNDSSND